MGCCTPELSRTVTAGLDSCSGDTHLGACTHRFVLVTSVHHEWIARTSMRLQEHGYLELCAGSPAKSGGGLHPELGGGGSGWHRGDVQVSVLARKCALSRQ